MSISGGEGIKLIVASIILWTLSTIAVLLRAIAIRIRKAGWKSHDYLTALALVCCLCTLPPSQLDASTSPSWLRFIDISFL